MLFVLQVLQVVFLPSRYAVPPYLVIYIDKYGICRQNLRSPFILLCRASRYLEMMDKNLCVQESLCDKVECVYAGDKANIKMYM